MRIAVAGGTGTVGRHVVDAARERGHEVVVLTRSNGMDLIAGTGVEAALAGVDAVIDASNANARSADAATEFFTTATRTLLAAEQAAGVGHHVTLSIVGIDRAPYGYYAGKLAQERAVEAGAVPFTIMRASQFHEFAEQMLGMLSFAGLHLAPRLASQPVAASEVGQRLVHLAEHGPGGRSADFAGPRREDVSDMVRRLARARGLRGPVLAVSLPGKQFAAMRRGDTLPGPDAVLASQTFEAWLGLQVAIRSHPAPPRP
ncbi:SDR family oxidoreductase [Agromyces aureus]|uniref:3-beta hydroxysteroid dehydrogenase n=1 Tax=Agromyces aureus TaxID=453304 RepID=A0A191WD49_9MICO|nr:NAD(P)H-binding protein [Agromyces aureus]ANJ26152.1 3-beta hydroxysteroid dehydrogenase [Agromyces aureus]